MIHINKGTNRRYVAVVRFPRFKRGRVVKVSRSKKVAIRAAAEAFSSDVGYQEAWVSFCSDYYDPMPIYRITRA